MNRPLLLAAAASLAALIPAAASAQTGYGAPSPREYRTEQQQTADLNDAVDDRTDDSYAGEQDDTAGDPRDQAYGGNDAQARYAQDRADYERRLAENDRDQAEYRTRSVEHREDLAAWRDRVAACNSGVRSACAGYEERYGSYGSGRYAQPAPAYSASGRYEDERTDQRDDDQDDRDDGYPGN